MKIATVNFPLNDNDGSSNADLIEQTAETFCRTYGGCTVTEGMGYWIDPETNQKYVEPVKIITAAVSETVSDAQQQLEQMARNIMKKPINWPCSSRLMARRES